MKKLSTKMENVPNSAIRKIFDMCIGVDDLIVFCLGEPDFDTPPNIVDAACKALRSGETRYTSNRGILRLRQSIAKMMKEKKQVTYDPETEIIVTTGGMQALFMSMSSLLNPGDEVVIGAPCFTNYFGQVLMNDGVVVPVPLKESDGFVLKVRELEKVVTEKTKVVLINSPSNPLGNYMNAEDLKELAAYIIEKDLYIISDEVYQNYLYDEGNDFASIAAIEGMKERTIIVDSFSKAYAMTGWRIGFAAAPAHIIDLMVKMVEGSVSCVNAAAQFAAIEALEGPQTDLVTMIDAFKKRRDMLYNGLSEIDKISCLKPEGAFYFFVNITGTGLSSEEFAFRLLKEQKVAVVPGTGFGYEDGLGEGYVRLAYVKSEEDIQEGVKRIKKFVESL